MIRPVRLAIVNSHPIQYFAPLYRRLAQEPSVDLHVYYCSRQGVEEYLDPAFGVRVKWDIPLLEGYRYSFLSNLRRPRHTGGFTSLVNPGIVPAIAWGRYDVVWVHGYHYFTHLLALAVARFCGKPVLYRSESSLTYDRRIKRPGHLRASKRIFLRVLFSQIDRFLSIGTRNTNFYRAHGVPGSKIFSVPYAVDNQFFADSSAAIRPDRARLRQQMGIGPSDVVFVFAAKMTKDKAPLTVLHAYRLVANARKALIMVGDGPVRQEAEAYARIYELPGVHFLGFVNQSELPRFYALSDVFVRPDGMRPGYGKGDWGLTVNEAMASGLAVIASSDIAATADLVKDGENGVVVAFGDVSELAGAMEAMVNDPAACRRMGQRSRTIIAEWSYAECVTGIQAALNSLYSRRPGIQIESPSPPLPSVRRLGD